MSGDERGLTALCEAARAVAEQRPVLETLGLLAEHAVHALTAKACAIYVYTPSSEAATLLACHPTLADVRSVDTRTLPPADWPLDGIGGGDVSVYGASVHGEDAVAAPLRFGDELVGVLVLRGRSWRALSQDERLLTPAFAALAANALANARSEEDMGDQVLIDVLTGLRSHRRLHERLDEEIARADRSGQPLSLLLIDLDDFKRFNELQGYAAGDDVLRDVGAVLRSALRKGVDAAARFGGEEFAVLLPGTMALPRRSRTTVEEPYSAVLVAERLRAAIGRIESGDAPAGLSASVGVAVYPFAADSAEQLVAQAETALAMAKQRGKDRVEVFTARWRRAGASK
jgi:diguanylate cyclase (GGDEF)-like protein